MNERLAEYNARRKHKRPIEGTTQAEARREKVEGQPCRVCPVRDVEAHHIVPRSQFGRRDTSVHDADNLMPLCHFHHQQHHTTANRILRRHLSPAERAFVRHRKSENWLNRWYPVGIRSGG